MKADGNSFPEFIFGWMTGTKGVWIFVARRARASPTKEVLVLVY
jgi:hypothetical protein